MRENLNVNATPQKAVLVLSNGERFEGQAYGSQGTAIGPLILNTAITGYQEVLTSETAKGRIILFTTPHIGNTGVNDEDTSSDTMKSAGVIVRDPARKPSNFRARRALEEDLEAGKVVGITSVDTRALTKRLVNENNIFAGIFSGDALLMTVEQQLDAVTATSNSTVEGA